MHSREALVDQFQAMLDFERLVQDEDVTRVPPQRLLTMLRQAVAYQMEFARYHTQKRHVGTLLRDYESFVIPNKEMKVLRGHKSNVKCVVFAGERVVSGSSDNTVMICNLEGNIEAILEGHKSRIWSVSASKDSQLVVSGSGDKSIKLWDIEHRRCLNTLQGHTGDVYAVQYHPGDRHVVSGGYDKVVRLHDLHTGQAVQAFSGHGLAVAALTFNSLGNLVVTGSKDHSVRFWDVSSGLCVKSITSHLGEVSSVQLQGNLLLTSSKDNANRIFDIRTVTIKNARTF